MFLMAIETSCDETSVAVLKDGCVLANAVSSQTKLHEAYGGVVPELASREHLRGWKQHFHIHPQSYFSIAPQSADS